VETVGTSELPGLSGLRSDEVAERVAAGQSNRSAPAPGRSLGEILWRNTFTWLNFILVALGSASLATGSGPDATFLVIAVINTVVGSVQEVRAKRSLDALAVINAPKVRAIRDGSSQVIEVEEVVLDDLLDLAPGDQVVADGEVAAGRAELDESLATGESDPVLKGPGDRLLSGTWVVSGSVQARVTAVGADSYAGRLAGEARRFSLTGSELMGGINGILRGLTVAMVIIGPILFFRQLGVQPWRPAVRSAVAGLVGMIPEGLVLLTTLAFLTAALRLGRRGVLVQELPAVEGLARVDALCTDKTGTITEGRVEWGQLIVPASAATSQVAAGLAALAEAQPPNATLLAVREGAGEAPAWRPSGLVPFSSQRKWSGATFVGQGTWVLGAPEVVAAADPDGLRSRLAPLAAEGARVLVLARGEQSLADSDLPPDLRLIAVVVLRERVRADAAETLSYFARQGVAVRVVSGDSAATAGAVAAQVGLTGANDPVDARSFPSDPEELAAVVTDHSVFGRVTPEQKREMVDALRAKGHVVAMTGDGVNDTLALKDADLGIAMGSGAAVARGVAQLVLLRNQFSVLPSVVSEGRRVLHNIEAVAVLFLVKNVYSIVISVTVAIAGWPYPFLPRHLTLISGLAIGIPAFFLALAPSDERFRAGFVRRVLEFAVVAGALTAAAVLISYAIARDQHSSPDQARTTAVLVTVVVSLWILVLASRPIRVWKLGLIAAVAVAFIGAFLVPGINTFFNIEHRPGLSVAVQSAAVGVAACIAITASVAWRRRRAPSVRSGIFPSVGQPPTTMVDGAPVSSASEQ
jgi:cation-transporting ATPase E